MNCEHCQDSGVRLDRRAPDALLEICSCAAGHRVTQQTSADYNERVRAAACRANPEGYAALSRHLEEGKPPPDDTIKKPRLFYYEESASAAGAWVPVPREVENIISEENFSGTDEVIKIEFKTFSLTDAEMAALPEI